MKPKFLPPWVLTIVLTAVYFLAAKLGLSMASVHTAVSPVWPPTGIAIGAVLLFGYKAWPGIMMGAFLANLSTPGESVAIASGIAIGNTLEAVSAAFLIHRYVGLQSPLDRAQDVFKFGLFAGMLATMASATIGTLTLCLGGAANWANYGSLWWTWWLGDGVGALVVAPLLLTWGSISYQRLPSGRFFEAALLLLLLSFVAMIVLGGWFPAGVTNYSLEYLTIPFLVWAAFRFGQRGVTAAIALLSGIAIWGTMHGLGPFLRETPNESLLLLQVFVGTIAVTSLVLAAVVKEREQAEDMVMELLTREQAARAEAEEANRIKDDFLATVSHELRTPLTSMLGWTRMLRSSKLNEATSSHALEVIERNAKLQAQLIDDLLDVSRIISGKLRLDIWPVELVPVIEAVIDSVRPAADAKEVKLQVALDPRASPVLGDPGRLQQIVWNLLSNAIKFTPGGGRVEIRLERVDSHIEIVVSDTGKGISAEFLPYVFDRFRQADSSITRAHGGLGLGLAIVRHLVELQGGTVHAYSSGEGQGSTFTVKFPIAQLRIEDCGLRTERIAECGMRNADYQIPQSEIHNPQSAILDGLRVLVVDDEPDTLEMLKMALKQCGAEVIASPSAAEALKALEEWHPDVLVSDIEMPGVDGYDLIQKVRAREKQRGGRIPALALTAYARTEDQKRVLSAGFQMYVPKPVEPAELATVVASLAGRA